MHWLAQPALARGGWCATSMRLRWQVLAHLCTPSQRKVLGRSALTTPRGTHAIVHIHNRRGMQPRTLQKLGDCLCAFLVMTTLTEYGMQPRHRGCGSWKGHEELLWNVALRTRGMRGGGVGHCKSPTR